MILKQLVILFLGLAFISFHGIAATTHQIKGHIVTNDGSVASGQVVKLFKIEMGERPALLPVTEMETDKKGAFSFSIKDYVEGTFYRVNTVIKDQILGSRPIRFTSEERIKNVELRQPGVIAGIENLTFATHLMVFEMLENILQVTEVINFENRTQSTVDTRGKPFIKKIPEQAINFQATRQERGVSISEASGVASIEFFVGPGTHQLFFNYDIPLDGGTSITLFNQPAPGAPSLELILSGSALNVSFQSVDKGSLGQITETKKFFNKQPFRSKVLHLNPGVTNVEVEISGIPMAQKKLFYPATILLVILLAGLFWYLKSKPNEIQSAA